MKYLVNSLKISILVILSALFVNCGDDEEEKIEEEDDANTYLNQNIVLPPGSFVASSENITESTTIQNTAAGSSTVTRIDAGDQIQVSIPFSDAASNVTHAGIVFGDPTGSIIMIPIAGAQGNSDGVLQFTMQIPEGICDDIGQICHDIRCYEFAVSADASGNSFQISRSNINQLASACGACEEPQCVQLLGEGCGLAGEEGSPRFNLTWDNSSVDLDLYVTEPNGETLGFGQSRNSSTGGVWDVDCMGGCTDENITWPDGGSSGSYQYYVNYFGGSGTANWQLKVFDGGRIVDSKSGSFSDGVTTTYTYNR